MGEAKWFLGVRRQRDKRKIWLCQDSYIDKITHRYHLEFMKSPTTPMALGIEELLPSPDRASPQQILHFQQKRINYPNSYVIPRRNILKQSIER
ncbi:hypothetical protein Egran_00423 [Elaphomyces granulatus]|uniref:Reverse transcriptase Ty1/copia-type domain-containing protein n=1 Tax=Elaphomyces granulatus TaxID=519963 RepID=A0A232M693_9EURO|nr:hypothetical protein Egran_00423 [Elaphomyces granulatus]